MTAYELADAIEDWETGANYTVSIKAAQMLRQLQKEKEQQTDRIAELEKDLALKTRDRDVFRDFTLAYEKRIAELEKERQGLCVFCKNRDLTPQTKPLSDEEILHLCNDFRSEYGGIDPLKLVRAIEEMHGIK